MEVKETVTSIFIRIWFYQCGVPAFLDGPGSRGDSKISFIFVLFSAYYEKQYFRHRVNVMLYILRMSARIRRSEVKRMLGVRGKQ